MPRPSLLPTSLLLLAPMWRIAANVYRTLLAIDASDTRPTFVDKPVKAGAGKQSADKAK